MKTPGDRLRELRIKKGFSTTKEAADAFGWNENTYKSHENGERGIRPTAAQKYAAAYGSTASFIMLGDTQTQPIIQDVGSVPVVGIVAAGVFKDIDFRFHDDTFVPLVRKKGVPMERQYAVLVQGPSVNRLIADGHYAICAPLDAFPGGAAIGSLVHACQEADGEIEHTIKELRVTSGGLVLMPVSDHPDFQEPVKIEENQYRKVYIHGIVVGSYRPF